MSRHVSSWKSQEGFFYIFTLSSPDWEDSRTSIFYSITAQTGCIIAVKKQPEVRWVLSVYLKLALLLQYSSDSAKFVHLGRQPLEIWQQQSIMLAIVTNMF